MKSPFYRGLRSFFVFALFIVVSSCWVGTLFSEQLVLKAPRVDAPGVGCSGCGIVTCPASADLDSIRVCMCDMNKDIDELFIDFHETWTAIAELQECCDDLHVEVNESFSETWTAIAELQECCDEVHVILESLDLDGVTIPCDEFSDVDDVDASEESIISWLKTLYAMNRGFLICDEPVAT